MFVKKLGIFVYYIAIYRCMCENMRDRHILLQSAAFLYDTLQERNIIKLLKKFAVVTRLQAFWQSMVF